MKGGGAVSTHRVMWVTRVFTTNLFLHQRQFHSFIVRLVTTKLGNQRNLSSMDQEEGSPNMSSEINGSVEQVEVLEGKVGILQPKSVFYNKVQEFNRDLSILAINTFIKNQYWKTAKYADYVSKRDIKILDALSATGLRAVRYAKEVSSGDHNLKIHANDLLEAATLAIQENAKRNGVEDKVSVSTGDASLLMYQNRKYEDRFLVVDIDPYGCPTQFLDGAVQCVSDGGLLMVTCTDLAILCGNHSETCFAKYGSQSLKMVSCHEEALRIVLRSIESCATRFGRFILPLLSISADFYVRLFIQVFSSPLNAKQSASKTGILYLCQGCHTPFIQPIGHYSESKTEDGKVKAHYPMATGPVVGQVCQFCTASFLTGGPVWIHPIHSLDFVDKMKQEVDDHMDDYKTYKRIRGMLEVVSEELPEVVLFRSLDELCKVIKCPSPSMDVIRSSILNAGYRVSYSHAHRSSIKTDAPPSFLWDVMKKWYFEHPVEKESGKGSKGERSKFEEHLLNQPLIHKEISFEVREDCQPLSKKKDFLRYQVNPERDWGPKPRPDNKKAKNAGDSSHLRKKFKIETTVERAAD